MLREQRRSIFWWPFERVSRREAEKKRVGEAIGGSRSWRTGRHGTARHGAAAVTVAAAAVVVAAVSVAVVVDVGEPRARGREKEAR